MVKVNTEKIAGEGLDIDEPLSVGWLAELLKARREFRPLHDGQVRAHLSRNEETIHLRGEVTFALEAVCGRCLEPLTVAIRAPLELTAVPASAVPSVDDGALHDEDGVVITYDNRELDLTVTLRDEIFLELPMCALCTPNCAGLCASCGQNLNKETCGCASPQDHRWAALKHMKIS